jgi:hypothetical protein
VNVIELHALPEGSVVHAHGVNMMKFASKEVGQLGMSLYIDEDGEYWKAEGLDGAVLVSLPVSALPTAGHMAWMMEDRLGPRVGDSAYTFVAMDIASVWS